MSGSLPKILADCDSKGFVIAPAGYGKTHLIALAVNLSTKRQLVLTHTFAGVNAIKRKMAALGVPSYKYQVDTIASWTLRLCLAYPKNSGWKVDSPTSKQWNLLYESCQKLLSKEFIRHIVLATYAGIYVDEYQDCSDIQHELICALADFMPCRVLGDPLQTIFDFGDSPVNWSSQIYPHFKCLGQLETPWRWINAGSPELGAWLKTARTILESGNKINFNLALPRGIIRHRVDANFLLSKQHSLLRDFLGNDDSVIAVHAGDQLSKNKTHGLAKNLKGRFSSIEEVECKALVTFLNRIDSVRTAKSGLLLAITFAKQCMNGVQDILVSGTKRGEIAKAIKTTKITLIPIMESANSYLSDPSIKNLASFFYLIKKHPDTHVYRKDLLNRFFNVLRIHLNGVEPTLLGSAKIYQREFRHTGRPIKHTKLIGTTLLVKGLEYDHAVLLEANTLSQKELYVAMTRGSKSLTIISTELYLPST
jgi:hypothetical protein